MRHLLQSVERPDVVEAVDAGAEAAVQTEDLTVDQRRQRQIVEQVGEVLPHVGVAVLAQTLVVEAVHLPGGGGGGGGVSVGGEDMLVWEHSSPMSLSEFQEERRHQNSGG